MIARSSLRPVCGVMDWLRSISDSENLQNPVGRRDYLEGEIDDLQQYPRRQHVGDTHAKDVSTFQFPEKTHAAAVHLPDLTLHSATGAGRWGGVRVKCQSKHSGTLL
jgi:hypothetical protein